MGIFSTPANILTAQRAQSRGNRGYSIMTFGRWLYNNFTGIVYCGHCNVCKHIRNIHTHPVSRRLYYMIWCYRSGCVFFSFVSLLLKWEQRNHFIWIGENCIINNIPQPTVCSLHAQIHSNTFGYFNNNVKSNLYICRSELSVCHNVALNTNYLHATNRNNKKKEKRTENNVFSVRLVQFNDYGKCNPFRFVYPFLSIASSFQIFPSTMN